MRARLFLFQCTPQWIRGTTMIGCMYVCSSRSRTPSNRIVRPRYFRTISGHYALEIILKRRLQRKKERMKNYRKKKESKSYKDKISSRWSDNQIRKFGIDFSILSTRNDFFFLARNKRNAGWSESLFASFARVGRPSPGYRRHYARYTPVVVVIYG